MNDFNFAEMTMDDVANLPRVAYGDRGELPKKPGVYFVLIEASDLKPIYIGSAFSLHTRIVNHNRNGEFEYLQVLGIPVYFAWLELDPESQEVDTIEKLLIFAFKPALNRYIPSEKHQEKISIPANYFTGYYRMKAGARKTRLEEKPLFGDVDDSTKKQIFDSLEYRVEDLTIRELRVIASSLKVARYSHSTRDYIASTVKLALGDFYDEARFEGMTRQKKFG